MKYFVTGATGFIGSRLAERLINEGHQVIALVRNPEKAGDLKALGATLVKGDITDKESMRGPMTGVDGVYHIAGWYKLGTKDTAMAEAINVGGTRNVCELMQELGTPKGVYTSTVAAYGNTHGAVVDETYTYDLTAPHPSEYYRTKALAHYEVALPMMAAGLPLVMVQPAVVYGKDDPSLMGDTIRLYLKGMMPLLPKEPRYCWAHLDDTVDGIIKAMEVGRPGESYNISGPAHSMVEAFTIAEEITGCPAPKLRLGSGPIRLNAVFMDLIGAVIPLPATFAGETLRINADMTNLATNAKARKELGFDPRPLREVFKDVLPYELEKMGKKPKK